MAINQLTLLAAIDDMDVWQEDDGNSVMTYRAMFGVSDPIADVTAETAAAEAAGLAVVSTGLARPWKLTDAGAAALHGKD